MCQIEKSDKQTLWVAIINSLQALGVGLVWALVYLVLIFIFSKTADYFTIKIARIIIDEQLLKKMPAGQLSELGSKILNVFSLCICVVAYISWALSYIRKKYFSQKIEEIVVSGKNNIEELKNKSIDTIDKIKDDGVSIIKKSFSCGETSLESIKNSIIDELENTANLISAKIDENLYSYSLLKKDMLNSQMIFIYGNFIYLKKTQSNEFLISALADKYWVSDSFRYLIIITQRNKETVRNIFEFLKKIKSGLGKYKPSGDDFDNFFIGFQNHHLELPSPVQLVAFVFNNKDYTIKKGLKINDIEQISFTGSQSLPVLKKSENVDEIIKVTAAIDQTLIFSNDLITHNTNIEKQIIGFKIPIKNNVDKDYEVLKEFDRLKSKVTYVRLKDIINTCLLCSDFEGCCEQFIESINQNNFYCVNKNT
jgi:hypothetical protein